MSDSATSPSADDLSSATSDEDQTKVETEKETNSDEQSQNDHDDHVVAKSATQDESLDVACKTMFGKISEYLQSELSASLEDYELLEKLNELTKQTYGELDNVTNSLVGRMEGINEKYKELQPYLEMIEKVDASVTNLEQAAYKLDAYSKDLEARFKKLEKTASS